MDGLYNSSVFAGKEFLSPTFAFTSKEPSVTYANMTWINYCTGEIKIRNSTNTAWIDLSTGQALTDTSKPTFNGLQSVT